MDGFITADIIRERVGREREREKRGRKKEQKKRRKAKGGENDN